MNTYTRGGKLASWEQDFLKEQTGISYEEDKQSYKRIQDYDAKHDTNAAEYYEHFHSLWYWDNIEVDWTKELRNSRDKDIYGNMSRVDLLVRPDGISEDEFTEITHDSSFKLDEMEKSSNVIAIRQRKSHMSAQDYQYHVDPFSTRWADLVIDNVDRERKATENNDIEVGLIRVPIRSTKLGYKTGNSELFIATLVFPDGLVIRESFKDVDLARIFLEEKRSEYKDMAFSWGAE
jgi:hypothetical protein